MSLLTLLGGIPLLGALVLALPVRGLARVLGLLFSLATLVVAVLVTLQFLGGADLSVRQPWITAFGANWALGLDGMGLVMVLLTVILTPLVLIAEWNVTGHGRWNAQGYAAMVLALQGTAIFTFLADDVLLFYVFFEATLIPMYFLIGGFGGEHRRAAALKFLMFNLVGGFILLAAVIGLFAMSVSLRGAPSYLLSDLAGLPIPVDAGRLLMVGFLIAFVIKAPMVPVHTWLPFAAEQATPGSSTLMVGILDKIGTFAMIKFCIGIFPEASAWIADSRPEPGPCTRTCTRRTPAVSASRAHCSAATVAANGVDFFEPLNPALPDVPHEMALPCMSVIVTSVLLNVALIWATPSASTTRLVFFPVAILLRHLLLAGDRATRSLLRARIGMSALAAHGEPTAMTDPSV